ncbi:MULTISPECIES: PhoH family protein [Micrococcus]|uniref:PhoH family protein n=1 Tax=Micrococcus cohnii TaxID=993416 RepID=UPI00130E391C
MTPIVSTPSSDQNAGTAGPRHRDDARLSAVHFGSADLMVRTLGPQDALLRILAGVYPDVDVTVRDQQLALSGPAASVAAARRIVEDLRGIAHRDMPVTADVMEQVVALVRGGRAPDPSTVSGSVLSGRGRKIRAKTRHQQDYVEAIDRATVVFGLGPAGTGKTYLAMAKAVQALQSKEVNRIILTRPAVEAGENLGYLPGSLSEKIDPYLRPLYDALHDMVEPESIPRLMEAGTIEVAPLAYMRGRTLNDAFVILDEAQNTTGEQMKMFLTRLGFGAHMVVTGDTSQVDLPRGTVSGLAQAVDVLEGTEGIEMIRFDSSDVVRHSLVTAIVDAYDRARPQASRARAGRPRHDENAR